jgi:hypothetical protein
LTTPTEVAEELIQSFDRQRSVLLEEAVLESLKRLGMGHWDAIYVADAAFVSQVRHALEKALPQQLPFEFSLDKPVRLIGKSRPMASDTAEARRIRQELGLIEQLKTTLAELDDVEFEYLCAAILLRSGASEAFVTSRADEGGIDFYGRIPILLGDASIPSTLVRTSLEVRNILFLGQSKRFASNTRIGRPELQKFVGQIRDCLAQYAGMTVPPHHHVPFTYYAEGEPAIGFYLTSAGFSADARDYAQSRNVVLADGQLLAELLLYWDALPQGQPITGHRVVEWSREVRVEASVADE